MQEASKGPLDTHAQDKLEDEDPTLFHVLKQRSRREILDIEVVQDADRTTYTSPKDIRNTFQHLARKIGPIAVDENVITDLLNCIAPVCPNT